MKLRHREEHEEGECCLGRQYSWVSRNSACTTGGLGEKMRKKNAFVGVRTDDDGGM